jgi:hypothetical protein
MKNNSIKGSIKTAADFWIFVLFLASAALGIYFIYGYAKENSRIEASEKEKGICQSNCLSKIVN